MDKLDKLAADIKAIGDALAQVHRSMADVRHEYGNLKKQADAGEKLAKEVSALQEKLAKITGFIAGG